jgi:cobalt-zinc-cadmium efflux system membrane fusion protein
MHDAKGRPGLRVTAAVAEKLKLEPAEAQLAGKPRPLPPLTGTLSYDSDRFFSISSRFSGEVVELATVTDTSGPAPKQRPLRVGDRVKPGALLAVLHSRELGEARAALVDALLSRQLSVETLERHQKLFDEGTIALATLHQSERQVQADRNAVLVAERTLFLMKLTDKEVQAVKDEANKLWEELKKNPKFVRNAQAEAKKFARVEIRVPRLDGDPAQELVIVEKNIQVHDLFHPDKDQPLFRVADLRRLLVVVQPPEQYLPLLHKLLDSPQKEPSSRQIEFQAATDKKPQPLQDARLAPLVRDKLATVLMGYCDNPAGTKYAVGQFVAVTIWVPADPDAVEIPRSALQEVAGGALVFVQPDPTKHEYVLRRVAVVWRFKDVVWVRTKLTAQEVEQAAQEAKQGKLPVEPLLPGERVVTGGVGELMSALEDLLAKEPKGGKK